MKTLHKASFVRATAVLLLFVALIIALGAPPPETQAAPEAQIINVLFVGDSITFGFEWVDPATGKVPAVADQRGTWGSFRVPVWQMFDTYHKTTTPQYNFKLVGTVNKTIEEDKDTGKDWDRTKYSQLPWTQPTIDMIPFIGEPGKTIQQIYQGKSGNCPETWCLSNSTVSTYLKNNKPDVALIHLGTNDVNQISNYWATSQTALTNILTLLKGKNPSMKVYVAQIIPANNPNDDLDPKTTCDDTCTKVGEDCNFAGSCANLTDERIEEFNARLRHWCDSKSPYPDPDYDADKFGFVHACPSLKDTKYPNFEVKLVDIYSERFSKSYLIEKDGVHPNEHGEGRIAESWYNALRQDYALPFVPEAFPRLYGYEGSKAGVPPATAADRYDVDLNQTLAVAAPGVLANDYIANGEPRVFYLTPERIARELYLTGVNWNDRDVTYAADPLPVPGSALTATTGDGQPYLYYLTAAGHIYQMAWNGSQWGGLDLTGVTGGTAAAGGSALASTTVNGLPRIYYFAQDLSDLHVHELAFYNNGWHHRDVTADAGAVPAVAGSALVVTTITNDDPRVYYVAPDYSIHELAWYDQVWHHRDITKDGDGFAVQEQSKGTLGVTTVAFRPHVYYLAQEHAGLHIGELAWDGSGWTNTDISSPTNQHIPDGAVLRTYGRAVYYVGADQHVHQLAWDEQLLEWVPVDLMEAAGAGTLDASGNPLAVSEFRHEPRVYYLAQGGSVVELARDGNAWSSTPVPQSTPASADSPLAATTGGSYPLTAQLDSAAEHGVAQLDSNGSFTYAPQQGYTGPDSFTYIANDGEDDSGPTTVTLDITDPCALVPGNLVANFCFSEGRLPWKFWHETRQGYYVASPSEPYAGARSAKVAVNAGGGNIQFYQAGLTLQPSTEYELEFVARSNNGSDMRLYVHRHNHDGTYTNYGLRGEQVNLEPYWKIFTMRFTTPGLADLSDGRLRFWLAPYAGAGTIYQIDRVLLRPVS